MTDKESTTERLVVELQSRDGTWHRVGKISNTAGQNSFELDNHYWRERHRPVLGQVFEEGGPDRPYTATTALPTWFSHLLPEGVLRRAVAEEAGVNAKREFFLLRYIGGSDLPGALRVHGEDQPGTGDARAHSSGPLEVSQGIDDATSPLKFSLAGIQLKFSLYESGEKGMTVPASGEAGEWIAKLPDRRQGFDGIPEAEHACLKLAACCGLEVPESRLVAGRDIEGLPDWASQEGDVAVAVRRFDRVDRNQRLHMEELAQVLNVSTGNDRAKYQSANFETVVRVTGRLCGLEAAIEAVRRIAFNILVGNGDAHVKNWAYIYPDGRTPRLSPVYDVVPTVLYIEGDDLGMNLSRSKRFRDIDQHLLQRFQRKVAIEDLDVLAAVRDMVERVVDCWWVLHDALSPRQVAALTAHRDALALIRL